MATHLNLEEQEQVDQLKHFWQRYGTLLTTLVVLIALGWAGWSGYRYWQNSQSIKSALLSEQVQQAAANKDWPLVAQALADVQQQYPGTDYAQQASLEAAKAYQEAGKSAESGAALQWLVASGKNAGYQAVARLRLASLALESKDYAAALQQLDGQVPAEFAGLIADKRGDVLLAQGQREQARSAYEQAWRSLDADADYRHLVEVKLNALGVDVTALAGQTS